MSGAIARFSSTKQQIRASRRSSAGEATINISWVIRRLVLKYLLGFLSFSAGHFNNLQVFGSINYHLNSSTLRRTRLLTLSLATYVETSLSAALPWFYRWFFCMRGETKFTFLLCSLKEETFIGCLSRCVRERLLFRGRYGRRGMCTG